MKYINTLAVTSALVAALSGGASAQQSPQAGGANKPAASASADVGAAASNQAINPAFATPDGAVEAYIDAVRAGDVHTLVGHTHFPVYSNSNSNKPELETKLSELETVISGMRTEAITIAEKCRKEHGESADPSHVMESEIRETFGKYLPKLGELAGYFSSENSDAPMDPSKIMSLFKTIFESGVGYVIDPDYARYARCGKYSIGNPVINQPSGEASLTLKVYRDHGLVKLYQFRLKEHDDVWNIDAVMSLGTMTDDDLIELAKSFLEGYQDRDKDILMLRAAQRGLLDIYSLDELVEYVRESSKEKKDRK